MKSKQTALTILWLSLFAFSCKKESVVAEPYLDEFKQYEADVQSRIRRIGNVEADSATIYMASLTKAVLESPGVCSFCVPEYYIRGRGSGAFRPLRRYAGSHPEIVALVLDKSLRGVVAASAAFYQLFLELYPEKFNALLKERGVTLIPDDQLTPANENENYRNKYGVLRYQDLIVPYLELTR